MEAADFNGVGPHSKYACCSASGSRCSMEPTLPPIRILMLLGLLHMALAQGRAAEILGLVAPLVLAAPIARQMGGAAADDTGARRRRV